MSDLSRHIRARMADEGVTQWQLADLLGVYQSEVSRRLADRSPWTVSDLRIVAHHFGVPLHELIRQAETREPV